MLVLLYNFIIIYYNSLTYKESRSIEDIVRVNLILLYQYHCFIMLYYLVFVWNLFVVRLLFYDKIKKGGKK